MPQLSFKQLFFIISHQSLFPYHYVPCVEIALMLHGYTEMLASVAQSDVSDW